MRALGAGHGGKLAQDFPLGARLADLARNLRTEHNAPLSAGLRAAIVLLVTRLGREQNHLFPGGDEHLVGEDDVLVDAQRHVGQGATDVLRLGQGTQKISAQAIQQIQFAARASLHHLRRRKARFVRHREAVKPGKRRCVLGVDGFSAGKRRRVSAHLGPALHRRMAANGHQPALVASDKTLRQAKIQNHLDGIGAEGVLRDPHAPHQHGRLCVADQFGEFLHAGAAQTGPRFELIKFQI